MLFYKIANYSVALLIFFILIVPVGLIAGTVAGAITFVGFVNHCTSSVLKAGNDVVSAAYVAKLVKKTIKNNTRNV